MSEGLNPMNISHESRGQVRAITPFSPALPPAKSSDKLPLRGHVPDKKVLREPPNLYLPSARTVYPDYLFFPGGYTAPAAGVVGAFAISPTDQRMHHRRIVTYSASRVSCTEVGPIFAKEHSANFDNHSRNFSRVDLTFNFEGSSIGVPQKNRAFPALVDSRSSLFYSNENRASVRGKSGLAEV